MSSPPYEKLALGFGVLIAAFVYAYWTYDGIARGEGWRHSDGASRALVVLGAVLVLALVLRLAVFLNTDRP